MGFHVGLVKLLGTGTEPQAELGDDVRYGFGVVEQQLKGRYRLVGTVVDEFWENRTWPRGSAHHGREDR